MIDTPLTKIEYGREIAVIVNGRLVRRNFDVLFCQWCDKQLKARRYKNGARAGQLYSSQSHNKRKFCCEAHRRAAEKAVERQVFKRPPPPYEDRTPGHPWLYRAGR